MFPHWSEFAIPKRPERGFTFGLVTGNMHAIFARVFSIKGYSTRRGRAAKEAAKRQPDPGSKSSFGSAK
jgi:hypothetical protein